MGRPHHNPMDQAPYAKSFVLIPLDATKVCHKCRERAGTSGFSGYSLGYARFASRSVELELSQLFAHINATCLCQTCVGRNGVCHRTRQLLLDQRQRLRATLISAKFAGPTSLLSSPGLRTFVVKNQVGIQDLVIGVRQ